LYANDQSVGPFTTFTEEMEKPFSGVTRMSAKAWCMRSSENKDTEKAKLSLAEGRMGEVVNRARGHCLHRW
jgi:hypothetical protein